MKNKINGRFMLIAALAIILTAVCTTIVYYRLFRKEVFENLKDFCYVMEETGVFESGDVSSWGQYANGNTHLRITVIDDEGRVLYDTYSEANYSDNHKDRPEIAQAYKNGSGQSIRRSTTINKSNYYYAILMKNGDVLRVAKETGSIVNLFIRVLPVILLISFVLFVICMVVGHYLTKSFVHPIEQVAANLDHLEQVKTYKELMPFVHVIRQQHEDILKGARMRQEFTANVSHELKTPLTSISGYSELIANGMVKNGDVERFALEIHRNAKRLISLINDIIQLSELDYKKEYDLVIEDVDLYELARNCEVMLAPVAEKKNITLYLEGNSKIVSGDKELLEEVIYNLCDNAIRYNKEGGHVWITVGNGFSVRDDGIGISKEHQERIFERFYRVDKSRSKKTGGTGLGLAIVKHIVELHEGKITVESDVNKGTTIKVEL